MKSFDKKIPFRGLKKLAFKIYLKAFLNGYSMGFQDMYRDRMRIESHKKNKDLTNKELQIVIDEFNEDWGLYDPPGKLEWIKRMVQEGKISANESNAEMSNSELDIIQKSLENL